MWEAYRSIGARRRPVLVWKPTLGDEPDRRRQVIAEAYAAMKARPAEYGAEFRRDLETTWPARPSWPWSCGTVERCRPPSSIGTWPLSTRAGVGGLDDAGDRHVGKDMVVLDALRRLCRHSARRWSSSNSRRCSGSTAYVGSSAISTPASGRGNASGARIAYQPADKTKGQIYAELLPLLNSGRWNCSITAHANQLLNLERRTSWAAGVGRSPPQRHDDLANAAAGVLLLAWAGGGGHASLSPTSADHHPAGGSRRSAYARLPVTGPDVRIRTLGRLPGALAEGGGNTYALLKRLREDICWSRSVPCSGGHAYIGPAPAPISRALVSSRRTTERRCSRCLRRPRPRALQH